MVSKANIKNKYADREETTCLYLGIARQAATPITRVSVHHEVLNNGGNVQWAYSQIDWDGARKNALVTGVMSLVISGASTIKLVNKRSTIEIGESNPARILVNTTVSRVSGITAEAWKEV